MGACVGQIWAGQFTRAVLGLFLAIGLSTVEVPNAGLFHRKHRLPRIGYQGKRCRLVHWMLH